MWTNRNIQRLFADNLKSQRKQRNLTKKKLAKLVGISKKEQTQYEKAIVSPNLAYLLMLSELGFDCIELINICFGFSNIGNHSILNLYYHASPEVQNKVLQMLLSKNFREENITNNNSAFIVEKQSIDINKSKIITTVICLDI